MKHPIEYEGKQVWHGVSGAMIVREYKAVWLAAGERLTVCAWCDADKTTTRQLQRLGFDISHGLCEDCAAKHFPIK